MKNIALLAAGAVILSLTTSRAGFAQSTATLGAYERPVRFQLSAGGNSGFFGIDYGQQAGPLKALDASVHVQTASSMNFRADLWLMDRHPDAASQFPYYERLAMSRSAAVILSGDLPMRLSTDLSIHGILGAGFMPYSHGVFYRYDANGQASEKIGRSATGYVFSAGIAFQWRHILIEQFVLQVLGADGAIGNGENAPLMIGWRF